MAAPESLAQDAVDPASPQSTASPPSTEASSDTAELEVEPFPDSDAMDDEEEAPYISDSATEEIIVTGKATEGMLDFDTADAITSFDAEDLKALGVASVADLSNFTPNLEIVNANPTAPTFFIRGVGLSDFNANSTGAVAVFHDDVALNSPALQSSIVFDAARINVLKGPQGSGPSRNASAGAIKIYNRKPSDELGGNLRVTAGDYSFVDVEGGLDVPILEDLLQSRVSFRVMKRDGTGTNRCGDAPPLEKREVRVPPSPIGTGSICGEPVNNNEISDLPTGLPTVVNDLNTWGARAQLRFTPDLWDMDWLLGGHMTSRNQLAPLGQVMGTNGTQRYPDGTSIRGLLGGSTAGGYVEPDIAEMRDTRRIELMDEGLSFSDALDQANLEVADELAANLDIRPRQGDYNRVGKLRNKTAGAFLRGDMSFGRSIEFTTITAYDQYDRHNEQDVDNTPIQLFELHQDDVGWQFTEDLRLNGEFNESVRWESGGYFLTERIDAEIENFFLTNQGISDRLYEQSLYSWAIYGGFEVDFWDDLNFYAGLRYNWEQKSMRYSLVFNTQPREAEDTQVRSAPTWTFRLRYAFSDSTVIYGKYSRGWKGGHFNAVGSLGDSGLDFAEPETVDSWEAGFHGFWLDRRVGMEASFFYYRYNDYQVFTFNQAFKSPPELIVINANDAENYGAEVDLSLRPVDPFMILFRMGWLESQFLDFTQENVATTFQNGKAVSFPVIVNNSGNRLINSPQIQFTIMAEYELDLGRIGSITPRYDTSWKSDSYFDATAGRGPPNVAQGIPILPENTIGQEAYWIHNFRLTYKLGEGDFQVAGWVRNFTDETYKAGGFNATGFNSFVVLFLGEPRTWGIDVSYQF